MEIKTVTKYKFEGKEYKTLKEVIGDIILPDWGESKFINYVAKDEENQEVSGEIEIIKLVNYQ